ncbi:MAG: RiPP maturation radical SAM C-methyltransferase [Saprospiraceae bacterium]
MKIGLINMPFGYLHLPSIALTQLKFKILEQFQDRVQVDLHYLNLDFGAFLGRMIYDFVAENPSAMYCNIGEWFFRQIAFPSEPDNQDEYLKHFQLLPEESEELLHTENPDLNVLQFYSKILLAKRAQLDRFFDYLIEKYHLLEYDVIGLTSLFSQNIPVFAMAVKLKEKNPKLIIVMGGANCESPMGEAIIKNIPAIDFVFSGPSLISFPEFISYLVEGQHHKCHTIDGVFSKENTNAVSDTAIGRKGKELPIDHKIRLDYDSFVDLINNRWTSLDIVPVLLFETSRGCWWGAKAHCTFCGLNTNNMSFRSMSATLAIDMLHDLFTRYSSVKYFSSVDNIMPRDYLDTVFPHLTVPPKVSLFYEVKADLTKQELEVLSKAHVWTMQPGIESLNTATLKLMKKGETAVGNIALLKNAASLKINLAWNLLIGFPEEPINAYEVYDQDLSFLYHLQPPKSVYAVRFDRYSPYFSKSTTYGLHLVPADFYNFLYPGLGFDVLMNIAYYFEDANQEAMHKHIVRQWRPVLLQKTRNWNTRFIGDDNLLKPMLYLDPKLSEVHDTRSGYHKIITLDPLALQILELTDQPVKRITIQQELIHRTEDEIDDALNQLITKNLIYHEHHKKYVSLLTTGYQVKNTKKSRSGFVLTK